VLLTLKTEGIAIRPSIFTPASLASLFPSTGLRRQNALITTLFPHLQHHPHLSWFILPGQFTHSPRGVENSALAFINAIPAWISTWTQRFFYVLNFPVSLTRQECRLKRETLEEARDRKAEELGSISKLRGTLEIALRDGDTGNRTFELAQFLHQLESKILHDSDELGLYTLNVSLAIQRLADITLPAQSLHTSQLRAQDLFRPSPLTLLWPRYLIAPAALYAIHRFTSHMSLVNMAKEIARTAENFFSGYLLGSIKNIVNTIRSGGAGGIIVKKEGIAADLQVSLHRIVIS
jgi:nuclear control of ATPase protein 2